MYVYVHVHLHIHLHVHLHRDVQKHVYVARICVHVYIYMYISKIAFGFFSPNLLPKRNKNVTLAKRNIKIIFRGNHIPCSYPKSEVNLFWRRKLIQRGWVRWVGSNFVRCYLHLFQHCQPFPAIPPSTAVSVSQRSKPPVGGGAPGTIPREWESQILKILYMTSCCCRD